MAAINLQLAGENYPGIRLVSSKEAGCVAIGDNNVFKIWKKDSEGKAIETSICNHIDCGHQKAFILF